MLGILAHRGLPVLWLTESNHGTASVRAISISYVDVMPSLPSAPAFAPGGTWLDGGLFRPEIVTRKGAIRSAARKASLFSQSLSAFASWQLRAASAAETAIAQQRRGRKDLMRNTAARRIPKRVGNGIDADLLRRKSLAHPGA